MFFEVLVDRSMYLPSTKKFYDFRERRYTRAWSRDKNVRCGQVPDCRRNFIFSPELFLWSVTTILPL